MSNQSEYPLTLTLIQMWASMDHTNFAQRNENYHYAPIDANGDIYYLGKVVANVGRLDLTTIDKWPTTYRDAKMHAPKGTEWLGAFEDEK